MKDGYKIRTLNQIIIKFYIPSNLQQLLSFKFSPKLVAKHALLILFGGCGKKSKWYEHRHWKFMAHFILCLLEPYSDVCSTKIYCLWKILTEDPQSYHAKKVDTVQCNVICWSLDIKYHNCDLREFWADKLDWQGDLYRAHWYRRTSFVTRNTGVLLITERPIL